MTSKRAYLNSIEKELQRLEREDPGVARAAASYRRMVEDVTSHRGLTGEYLADLYDVSKPLPTCGYDGCTELPVDYAVPLNPRTQGYPACAQHLEMMADPNGKSFHHPPESGSPQDESPGQS